MKWKQLKKDFGAQMRRIMENKYIGSDFDNFLQEEGILEEIELSAIKKVIAYELLEEMSKNNITQIEMARKLGTSRSALRRVLDINNCSITLLTLGKIAKVLGKKLEISLRQPIRTKIYNRHGHRDIVEVIIKVGVKINLIIPLKFKQRYKI